MGEEKQCSHGDSSGLFPSFLASFFPSTQRRACIPTMSLFNV